MYRKWDEDEAAAGAVRGQANGDARAGIKPPDPVGIVSVPNANTRSHIRPGSRAMR
jgi:hypothetical protein